MVWVMLFEGIVSQVLSLVLGNFINDVNADQLQLGISKGEIELNLLEIKPTALDFLNLPIKVTRGVLGTLHVTIPWSDLLNSPIRIILSDIVGLVEPQTTYQYDAQKEEMKEENEKKMKIAEYEKQKNQSDGFVTNLIGKIIENIHISVENVHFQFTKPDGTNEPFTLGVTIDSVSVSSIANEKIPNMPLYKYKMVNLTNLAVYVCPHLKQQNISSFTTKQFITYMRNLIIKPYQTNELTQHILVSPTSVSVIVALNLSKGFNSDFAKIMGQVDITDVTLSCDKTQFVGLISLLDVFFEYGMSTKYLKYRPQNSSVKKEPEKWWKYAFNVIKDDLKNKKQHWNGEDTDEYMKIYKKTLGYSFLPSATDYEIKKMEEYEKKMGLEEILHNQQKNHFFKKAKEYFMNKFIKQDETFDTKTLKDIGVFEVDPDAVHGEPAGYEKMKFGLSLKKIRVKLTENGMDVLDINVSDMSAKMILRPQGFVLVAEVDDISIAENCSEKSWKYVLKKETHEKLITVKVEQKPLDNTVDLRVDSNFQPVYAILYKEFIQSILSFVTLPDNSGLEKAKQFTTDKIMDVWSSVQKSTVQNTTNIIETNKKEKRFVMDINVSVIAPKIAVLLDVKQSESLAFVVDLGRLKVSNTSDDSYDIFNLKLDDISLSNQKLVANSPFAADPNNYLLEPISFDVSFAQCVKKNKLLPHMKLNALINQISLNCSVSKYDVVMKFVEVWSTGWKQTQNITSIATEEDTEMIEYAEILQKIEHENFLAMRSDVEQCSLIKIDFGLELLRVCLKRKDDEEKDLVIASIRRTNVIVEQKSFALDVEASIGMVKVDDCICGNQSDFIISTDYYSSDTFFVTKVHMIQPESLDYNNVDLVINAQINDFYVAFKPETVGQLALFALTLTPPNSNSTDKEVTSTVTETTKTSLNTNAPTSNEFQNDDLENNEELSLIDKLKTKDTPQLKKNIQISIKINRVGLLILNETEAICSLGVENINCDIDMFDWGLSVRGSLQKVYIEDLKSITKTNQFLLNYTEVDPLILFKFNMNNLNKKMFIKKLNETVKEQRQNLNDEVRKMALTETEINNENFIDLSKLSTFELLPNILQIHCEIKGPEIRIPVLEHVSNAFILNLGNLYVKNSIEKGNSILFGEQEYVPTIDKMNIKVDSISLITNLNNHTAPILKELKLIATISRPLPLDCFTNEMKEMLPINISTIVQNIDISIAYEQIKVILDNKDAINFSSDSEKVAIEKDVIDTPSIINTYKEWPPVCKKPSSLDLSIELQKISVELHTNTGDSTDGLMQASIEGLNCGIMLSRDKFVNIKASLTNCNLLDIRPNDTKNPKLIQTVIWSPKESNLLEISFKMHLPTQFIDIDSCIVEQPTLYILPTFIGDTLSFVNKITELLPKNLDPIAGTYIDVDPILEEESKLLTRMIEVNNSLSKPLTKLTDKQIDNGEYSVMAVIENIYQTMELKPVEKQIVHMNRLKNITVLSFKGNDVIKHLQKSFEMNEQIACAFMEEMLNLSIIIREKAIEPNNFEPTDRIYFINPSIEEHLSITPKPEYGDLEEVLYPESLSTQRRTILLNVEIRNITVIAIIDETSTQSPYFMARTTIVAGCGISGGKEQGISAYVNIDKTDFHRGSLKHLLENSLRKKSMINALKVACSVKLWNSNNSMNVIANVSSLTNTKMYLSYNDVMTLQKLVEKITSSLPKQESSINTETINESTDKTFKVLVSEQNKIVVKAIIDLGKIDFCFVNDLQGRTLPLVCAYISNTFINGLINGESISAFMNSDLSIDFFNDQQMQYESLLDTFHTRIEAKILPCGVSKNVFGNIIISPIQINICHSMITTVLSLISLIQKDIDTKLDDITYISYLNETGINDILLEDENKTQSLTLCSNVITPLTFDFETKLLNQEHTGRHLITNPVGGILTINNEAFDIDLLVCRAPKIFKSLDYPLVTEVLSQTNGTKLVYLRSDVVIENKTDYAIDWIFIGDNGTVPFTVEKKIRKSVPIQHSRNSIALDNKDSDKLEVLGKIDSLFEESLTKTITLQYGKETKHVVIYTYTEHIFQNPHERQLVIEIKPMYSILNNLPYPLQIATTQSVYNLEPNEDCLIYEDINERFGVMFSPFNSYIEDPSNVLVGEYVPNGGKDFIKVVNSLSGIKGHINIGHVTQNMSISLTVKEMIPGIPKGGIPPNGKPFITCVKDGENLFDLKSHFKTKESEWSDELPTIEAGYKNVVNIKKDKDVFDSFRYEVSLGNESFSRTKVISIYNNYVLANNTDELVTFHLGTYKQVIQPQSTSILDNMQKEHQFQFETTEISVKLPLDEIAEYPVKLGSKCYDISVQDHLNATYVCIHPRDSKRPPFRIINESVINVIVTHENDELLVNNNSTVDYYIRDITKQPIVQVQKQQESPPSQQQKAKVKQVKLDFNALNKSPKIISGDITTYVTVISGVRSLIITDKRRKQLKQQQENLNFHFNLSLNSIVCNVSDSWPDDILFLTINQLTLEASRAQDILKTTAEIQHIQIDNMVIGAPFPVLLTSNSSINVNPDSKKSPSPSNTKSDSPPNSKSKPQTPPPKPALHTTLVIRTSSDPTTYHLDFFTILLQQIDIALDGPSLMNLLTYVTNLPIPTPPTPPPEFGPYVAISPPPTSPTRLYIQRYMQQPIKLVVTFQLGTATLSLLPYTPLTALIHTFGSALTSISTTPIPINAVFCENVFTAPSPFVSMLIHRATLDVVRALYLILGSADFLGNPVALLSNVGGGVQALFYEPLHGLTISPGAFAGGLVRGTGAFVSSAGGGLLHATSRVTGAIASGVAALAMDEDFMEKRARKRNEKPTSAMNAVAKGTSALGDSLVDGVTGVFMDPVRKTKKEGLKGIGKGVGKGLVGLVAKPISGVADFVATTTGGFADKVEGNVAFERLRKPRLYCGYFGTRGYSTVVKKGYEVVGDSHEELIKRICELANEEFIGTYEIDDGIILVLTENRIVLFEYLRMHFINNYLFDQMKDVSASLDGITIVFTNGLKVSLKYSRSASALAIVTKMKSLIKAHKSKQMNKENEKDLVKSTTPLQLKEKSPKSKSPEKKEEINNQPPISKQEKLTNGNKKERDDVDNDKMATRLLGRIGIGHKQQKDTTFTPTTSTTNTTKQAPISTNTTKQITGTHQPTVTSTKHVSETHQLDIHATNQTQPTKHDNNGKSTVVQEKESKHHFPNVKIPFTGKSKEEKKTEKKEDKKEEKKTKKFGFF
ncbi:Vacuolar protein sorting-associated protein [Entamoeba marina]